MHALLAEGDHLLNFGKGTTHTTIYFPEVLAFHLNLPPLAEQHRIVEKVEALLAQVNKAKDRLDRVKVILKRFRQAVLAAACSGRLTEGWRGQNPLSTANDRAACLQEARLRLWTARQSADRKPRRYVAPFLVDAPSDVDLPEAWTWTNVSHMSLLDVGFAFKSAEYCERGVRLLRGENVEPGRLRWAETKFWADEALAEHQHLLVQPGEIILALDRPLISTGLKIARVAASDVPALLVQRVMRFAMVDPADADFLFLVLQQQRFIEFLRRDGLTGTDLPHITGTGVAEFAIPLPPVEEQRQIVRVVARLLALADALDARVVAAAGRTDKLPHAILAKAFRGELVSTEPELARVEDMAIETAEDVLGAAPTVNPATVAPTKRTASGGGRGTKRRTARNVARTAGETTEP